MGRPVNEYNRWDRDDAIVALWVWVRDHGRLPGSVEWERPPVEGAVFPSRGTVRRLFGSWAAFVLEAGFTPLNDRRGLGWQRKQRKDHVRLQIRTWALAHGRPPARNDWPRATPDYPSSYTVVRLFGSWNEAIRSAGLVPRPRGRRVSYATGPGRNLVVGSATGAKEVSS